MNLNRFIIPIALVCAVLIHPLCVVALLFAGGSPLGANYTASNVQTASGIVTQVPNNREEAWAKKIILGAYNLNVFAEHHIGPEGSGKAFIDYTDTRRIRGNKIFLTDVAQLGAEGVQGDNTRNGNEENIQGSEQAIQVGRHWFGMGVTTIAQAETVIGSEWDRLNSPLLEQRVGLKKSNDMQMVLRESSTSDNEMFPNGKSFTTLKTADTFGTGVITDAGVLLSGLGANPASLVKDKERGMIEGYCFTGALDAFASLYADPTYQSVVEKTGAMNGIITGRFSDWNGHKIYPLHIRLKGGKGSVGSPLLRRAFLGVALPTNAADDTQLAGVITGGGTGYANANKYFEHFSGYAYKMSNGCAPIAWTDASTPPTQAGSTYTGETASPWYVAIIDKTTGKYSLHSYTGNTGATLTGVKRLGASDVNNIVDALPAVGGGDSAITYSTGTYNASSLPITTASGGGALGLNVGAVAQGSLIVEVNCLAVPFIDIFALGSQAGVCGYGRVPGASGFFGKRTKEVQDHERSVAVGYEFSFGCKAYVNVDNVPTNYVRLVCASPVRGLPTVA